MGNNTHTPLPIVTVGIPVYNGAQGLPKVIESLHQQTYPNIEIIIVDNCSIDNTVEVIQDLMKKHSNIRLHQNSSNIGMNGNFNRAMELGIKNSDYFMWAAHDDTFDPEFINTVITPLLENPSLLVCSTYCESIQPNGKNFIDTGLSTLGKTTTERFREYREILHRDGFVGGIFYGVYRSTGLSKIRPMKDIVAADHLTLLEISILGDIHTIPTVLLRKEYGGASESVERLIRAIGVKNLFHRKLPYFKRELEIQTSIFISPVNFAQKIIMSFISLKVFCYHTLLYQPFYRSKHQLKVTLLKLVQLFR